MNARGRGWAYTGAVLGGLVSVAANVAHSYVPPAGAGQDWTPQPGAVALSVFWPVATLVGVEILARTTWPAGRRWVLLRFGGLLPVALVAAVVSYRHLSGLLAFYGEDSVTQVIGPLAVDGLMLMATGALIATGVRSAEMAPALVVAADMSADTGPDTEADIRPDTAADITPDTEADTTPDIQRTPVRTSGRTSKPDTATAVARLAARYPDWSSADIARRLRVSDRTVRRHLSSSQPAAPLRVVASGKES